MDLWRLLAHNHWITLDIFGRKLRLCARCSGYVSGSLILITSHELLRFPFFGSLNARAQMFLCFILLLPSVSDWMTQSWGWRESNNGLRLLTGLLLGFGVYLFFKVEMIAPAKVLIYGCSVAILSIAGVHHGLRTRQTPLPNPHLLTYPHTQIDKNRSR